MRMLIAAAFSLAALGAAQAMPVAPAPAGGLATPVAQGCGPGFHRDLTGRCVPNVPFARPCPPGFRRNKAGRCVPIR